MNSKFIFIIAFFAIFLGIASLTGIFSSKPHQSLPSEVKKEPVKIEFYIARQTIRSGQSFYENMISKQVMLQSHAIRLYGISHSIGFHFFNGMVARRDISQGEVVEQQDFATPKSQDYLTLITPEDKIAYPLAFPRQQINVMKIHANEYVDIMLLSSSSGTIHAEASSFNRIGRLTVSPLLRHVKVLTVHSNSRDKSDAAIVLALSQGQIAKTIIAQRIGKLYIFRTSSSGIFARHGEENVTVRDVIPGYVAVKALRGESLSVVNATQER